MQSGAALTFRCVSAILVNHRPKGEAMPVTPRPISERGYYHLMVRGNSKLPIFEERADYIHFLNNLKQYSSDHKIVINAYCLMPNHVHLLLQEKQDTLGEVVKRITIAYAYYFNRKYQRNGYLFQDRFRSEPVDDIKYFKTLLRYIHLNPVHAGLSASTEDYVWSSWHEYEKKYTGLIDVCNTAIVLNRISWKELYDYVCESGHDDGSILEMDDEPPRSVPDSAIKEFLSARYGISNMMELQNVDKNKRNIIIREVCEQGAGFRQLARITGISYGIIQRVVTDRRTAF